MFRQLNRKISKSILRFIVCLFSLLFIISLLCADSTPSNGQKKFIQGVNFYQKGDYLKAVAALSNLYRDYPIYSYARIIVAKSYLALGQYKEALQVLEDESGKKWNVAYEINIYKARTFLKMNRLDEGQKAAECAYQNGLTDREKIPALRLLGDIFSGQEKYILAVDNLFKLIELSDLRFLKYERADLFDELYQYLQKLNLQKEGNLRRLFRYALLILKYGEREKARLILELYEHRLPVDLRLQALFELTYLRAFHVGEHLKAQDGFTKILKQGPPTSLKIKTLYYQAINFKQIGNEKRMLEILNRLMADYPDSYYSCLAAKNIIKNYESGGNLRKEEKLQKELKTRFENTACWEQLLWKFFFLAYSNKDLAMAGEYLSQLNSKVNPVTPRLAYWNYKFAKASHDLTSKQFFDLIKMLNQNPLNYYSLLADEKKYDFGLFSIENIYHQAKFTAQEVTGKLLKEESYPSTIQNWVEEADLLSSLGLTYPAICRLNRIDDYLPEEEVFKLRFLWQKEGGQYRLALQQAGHLYELYKKENQTPSISIIQGLYPRHFNQEVKKASLEYAVPKELIYGIMREESGFDNTAFSTSKAHGLMQLVPATAREIAHDLSFSDFELKDLFDPTINIQLGSYYLHRRIEQFEDFRLAIASYHGGPGKVSRWRKEFTNPDIDLFVELIPSSSTQNYVKRVYRNFLIYSHLYGDK